MITWLYAIICSQALCQTERGGRGYTCYHAYPPTYTHTNMYTHTHMYMSPKYICSAHMFTCTRIHNLHTWPCVHWSYKHVYICIRCIRVCMSSVHPFCMYTCPLAYICRYVHVFIYAYAHMYITMHMLRCSPVHMCHGSCTHMFMCPSVHMSVCTHVPNYTHVHVFTCTCVCMYTCPYSHMLTCT